MMNIAGRATKRSLSILFFIALFLFCYFADSGYSFEIDDGSELKWNVRSIDEIIKITDENTAEISVVIMFEFLDENISKYDYEIDLNLGKNADIISVRPTDNDNFNYSKYFNYSVSTRKDENFLSFKLDRNVSNIYQIYYVAFQYNIITLPVLKSEPYESPKLWKINYKISHANYFNPQFRIYFALPKNSFITYTSFNLSYPLELRGSRFDTLHAFPWNWSKSSYETVSLDTKIPDIEDFNVILFDEEDYDENKLTINYETSDSFIEQIGFIGLIAGIIGSIFGAIGIGLSIITIKAKKTHETITKIEKVSNYEDKIITKRISSSIEKISKLDSLLLTIPSVIAILGFFIQLFINSQIQNQLISQDLQSEILYYLSLPFLFFTIFMPLYIGYWRGAITQNLIIERLRGWTYLIEGSAVYLSSIVLFFVFITLSLIQTQFLIFFGISIIIIQVLISIGLKKIIVPFTNSFYKSFGRKRKTKKDKIILGRTYLASISFSFFFWSLSGSMVMFAILKRIDTNFSIYALFPLAFGIFVLYYALNSEKITCELVENTKDIDSIHKYSGKQITIRLVIAFIVVTLSYLIYYFLFKHMITNLFIYLSLGIVIYYFLNWLEIKFENKILEK